MEEKAVWRAFPFQEIDEMNRRQRNCQRIGIYCRKSVNGSNIIKRQENYICNWTYWKGVGILSEKRMTSYLETLLSSKILLTL